MENFYFKKQRHILLIFFTFLSITMFSQDLIKTSEYIEDKKRRDLFYNNKMKLVKEIYYQDFSQKIINIINYDSLGNIVYFCSFDEYPKINIEVNFQKGIYNIPDKKIELHFKGDFIFHGQQTGEKIIVNYKDGEKFGRLIQTDSGVSGKQTVIYQKVDPRFLKFNIIKFYEQYGTEDVFKLFNGVILNYKNNVLDGVQKSFYLNGDIKFISNYSNGLISDYTSYSNEKNILSKIITDSGIVRGPVILNGVLTNFDEKNYFNQIFSMKNINLDKTGDIIRENLLSNTNEFHYQFTNFIDYYGKLEKRDLGDNNYFVSKILNPIELKRIFDEKKSPISNGDILRVILSIPKFSIQRLNFQNDEKFELIRVDTLNLLNPQNKKIISNSFIENKKIEDLLFKSRNKELTTNENYIFFRSIIENTIENISELEHKTYNFKNPYNSNIFNPDYNLFEFNFNRFGIHINDHKVKFYSLDSNIYIELMSKEQIVFKKYNEKYVFIFGTNIVGDLFVKNVLKYHNGIEEINFSKINELKIKNSLSEYTNENILEKICSKNGYSNLSTLHDIILSGSTIKDQYQSPFKIKYLLPNDLSYESIKNGVLEQISKISNKYQYKKDKQIDTSNFLKNYIDVMYTLNPEQILFEKNYSIKIVGIEDESSLLNVEFTSPLFDCKVNKFYDLNNLTNRKTIFNFTSNNINLNQTIFTRTYSLVNGINIPIKYKSSVKDNIVDIVIENIETNTGITSFN
jgi:hypothetical protein